MASQQHPDWRPACQYMQNMAPNQMKVWMQCKVTANPYWCRINRHHVKTYWQPSSIRGQKNKKALLSQRQPCDAPNIWVPWKVSSPRKRPRLLFPKFVKNLLFRSILRMCIQNSKFVALSVPEIIGGTQKIWAVPRYTHAPFSLKFLIGFCSYGPSEYICQIWSS